jgi:ribosomal protein S18 acetylase RimI-like enzyme
MVTCRQATAADHDALWSILEPVIRAGETYSLPRHLSRTDALSYWFEPGHEVWVAEVDGEITGTYFIRPNQQGGGAHVANCGYMTSRGSEGKGIARAMCRHSLQRAKELGFRAMQFNFVVSTNERAVRLWQSCGFEVIGRLPGAFAHPSFGDVDALVMYRRLDPA